MYVAATLSGISVERLQTLCAVVESGSIVAAAGTDPNRQSQYSRQLKELEKAIGVPLFDRVGKNLQPNQMGRRVAVITRTFFAALDDLMNVASAQAETVKLGAGEGVLRWLVMPHLPELMAGDPPTRYEVRSLTTESVVRELSHGTIDLAIVRSEAVAEGVESEEISAMQYSLAVPRGLLRSREAAEVLEGRPLPFAELAGDGVFANLARRTAATLGINLRPILQAQTFSLLMSAVETGVAAAFLPTLAAKSLPEQRFAAVSVEGMQALNRSLSLAWKSEAAESRPSVRRAIGRLLRVV